MTEPRSGWLLIVPSVLPADLAIGIGIDEFGACGPGIQVMPHHGFTVDAVGARIHEILDGNR